MKSIIVLVYSFQFILLPCLSLSAQSPSDSLYRSSIIQIEEVQKRNYRHLADILFDLPGVWIRDLGTTGQWSSFRLWGSNVNQVGLLLDGCPLSDPWSGEYDLNTIPVEMIERVEVFSTLNPFGYNPIGGVVNLVTKRTPSNRPYTKIVYRDGKNDFSDLDITFSQKFTPHLDIISGALLKKYGETLPNIKYSGQKIRSKISYSFSPKWKIQYSILQDKSDLDLPYKIQLPGDTLLLDLPHRKRIRYDHVFQTDWELWKIQTKIRFDHTSISYEIRENFNPIQTYPIKTTAFFLDQHLNLKHLLLSWGTEIRHRQLKDHNSLKHSDWITQGFLNGNIDFFQKMAAVIQMHAKHSTDKKTRLSLSTQLSWQPSSPYLFWVSYSQGMRNPSLGERFGYPFYPSVPVTYDQLTMRCHSHETLPNPSLKPEISQTGELGIRWESRKTITTSLRGYIRSTKNLIQGVLTDKGRWFTNQSKTLCRGIETQFHAGPFYGFQALLVLNILKATDAGGNNLLERSNLWGNGSLSWNRHFFQRNLNVHLCVSNHYWSGFWNLVGNTVEESYLLSINPVSLIDFKLTLTFLYRVKLTFAIDNLIGTETALVSNLILPKQTTRLGIAWELFD
jgi:outer membrane cobalamin receptor